MRNKSGWKEGRGERKEGEGTRATCHHSNVTEHLYPCGTWYHRACSHHLRSNDLFLPSPCCHSWISDYRGYAAIFHRSYSVKIGGKGFKLHFLFRPQLARLDYKNNAVFVVVVVDDAAGETRARSVFETDEVSLELWWIVKVSWTKISYEHCNWK